MPKPLSISNPRQFLGHVSIYGLGRILRQLIGFIMLPIYTRYLSPADYGIISLMIFAISLIEITIGARIGQAIPKYYYEMEDVNKQAGVISTAMILTGVVTAILSFIMIFFRDSASQLIFGTHANSAIVGCFAVLLFTQAMEYYALIYIRIKKKPFLYIILNLIKLLLQLSLNIWFVVIHSFGVIGIAISSLVSSLIFSIILLSYTFYHVGLRFSGDFAFKMLKFSWPLWLAGIGSLYIESANRYYLRLFASMEDIGLYELASKFSAVITLLIWDPFETYWQVERFNYYRRGNDNSIFKNVFQVISSMLLIGGLVLSFYSKPILQLIANPVFYKAGESVPFLVFAAVFNCLISYFNFSFLIKEKTEWITRNNYLIAIFVTIFYLLLIPLMGHKGAALALMLAQSIQLIIVYRASGKLFDMKISKKNLIGIFIIAVCSCLIVNNLLIFNNLIEDLIIKTFFLLIISMIILLPIWKNVELRFFFKKLFLELTLVKRS